MRISVELPESLSARAEQEARAAGLSLGQWVTRAVKRGLRQKRRPLKHSRKRADRLYSPSILFTGEVEADVSERHDDYLYNKSTHDNQ